MAYSIEFWPSSCCGGACCILQIQAHPMTLIRLCKPFCCNTSMTRFIKVHTYLYPPPRWRLRSATMVYQKDTPDHLRSQFPRLPVFGHVSPGTADVGAFDATCYFKGLDPTPIPRPKPNHTLYTGWLRPVPLVVPKNQKMKCLEVVHDPVCYLFSFFFSRPPPPPYCYITMLRPIR